MPCVVKGEFEVKYQRYSCTLARFHVVVKANANAPTTVIGYSTAYNCMVVKVYS